jgi:hypothetical protein
MKTLQDVAKQYRKSAAKAIYPGLPYSSYKRAAKSSLPPNPAGQGSRAFNTGNLLTKFISSPQNNINIIGSKVKDGYQFVLDIAPNGAEYGRWVHYGTRRMIARPFVQIGIEEDPDFEKVLDEFLLTETDKMVDGELELIDDMFNKAGWKVS